MAASRPMLPARRAPSIKRSTRSAGVCDPFGTSRMPRHDGAAVMIGAGFARTAALRSISIEGDGDGDGEGALGNTIDGADAIGVDGAGALLSTASSSAVDDV